MRVLKQHLVWVSFVRDILSLITLIESSMSVGTTHKIIPVKTHRLEVIYYDPWPRKFGGNL